MDADLLALDPRFDPATQAVVGTLAAGLDDQLEKLRKDVRDLSVAALEWQPAPGMNSIGMLLAHLALVEVWWIDVAPSGAVTFAAGEAAFRSVVGIGGADDGMPLAAGGGFPPALRGRTAAQYLELLDRARVHVRQHLVTWTDAALGETIALDRGAVSRRWILYHVLEHFAGHYGQVLLLRHHLRDAGI